ncbi:hypothetical protein ACFE04_000126 [Oxalis oulophora]
MVGRECDDEVTSLPNTAVGMVRLPNPEELSVISAMIPSNISDQLRRFVHDAYQVKSTSDGNPLPRSRFAPAADPLSDQLPQVSQWENYPIRQHYYYSGLTNPDDALASIYNFQGNQFPLNRNSIPEDDFTFELGKFQQAIMEAGPLLETVLQTGSETSSSRPFSSGRKTNPTMDLLKEKGGCLKRSRLI